MDYLWHCVMTTVILDPIPFDTGNDEANDGRPTLSVDEDIVNIHLEYILYLNIPSPNKTGLIYEIEKPINSNIFR